MRQIGEKYFLQLKAPISENGALHVKKEYEQQLDSLPEKLTAQELSQLVGRDFPAADLAGSLHTQRKLCTDFDHVEICLDKSEYLGLTDYELELECRYHTGESGNRQVCKVHGKSQKAW